MPITYASISGRITLPGSDIGVQARVSAVAMTTQNALAFPGDRLTWGMSTVETDPAGNLTVPLKIPIGSETTDGETVRWRIVADPLSPVPGVAAPLRLGTFEITGDSRLDQLVDIESTPGTPPVVTPPGGTPSGGVPTSRQIATGTGLVGGGDLTADRTIALATASQESLAKADTAVQLVDDLIPLAQVPKSQTASPSSIVQRTGSGTIVATAAANSGEVTTKQQVDDAIAGVSVVGNGAVVLEKVLASTITLVNATDWVSLPDLGIANAKTGEEWNESIEILYEGSPTGGIDFRIAQGAAGGNDFGNPSFETGLTGLAVAPVSATLTRATAGGGYDGAAYAVATAGATATMLVRTDISPITPGTPASAGARLRWGAGATPRTCRVDIEYLASDGTTVLQTDLGPNVVPATSGWAAVKRDTTAPASSTSVAPTGATGYRARVAVLTPAVGDSVHIDGVQLSRTGALPAFSAGGAGINVADYYITGVVTGLTLTGTTIDDYRRTQAIRYGNAINAGGADVAVTGNTFGGLGVTACTVLRAELRFKVVGSGITAGIWRPEVRQKITDAANPTVLRPLQSSAILSRLA